MQKGIYYMQLIFSLNERLFINALAGVTDELAAQRLSGHNNPLNWLAAHTVWARFNTAGLLGQAADNPYKGYFEGFKPFEETMQFGNIEKLKEQWKTASSLLNDGLANVDEATLAADAPFKNPAGDHSIGGAIAFLAEHESYDIGQMGLLKKFLTKEAMSYN